ncbi:uncharacterized protein LOC111670442 [Seriola lalandi dorsalis]|uniref:uncharacterized protein LOC111670442 n=1 Tax=Seriola lalandi dorsalis TaxID=1841481 RepID=UPI000C6FAA6E|nr:uncharacterized protein LOC111670442 [Seriola lalandi dorsalis]
MKLLLSSLRLASLCAISSWTASSTDVLVVTQSPDVSVLEGETVNITCCWKGTFDRITFNWGRNQTVIKTDVYNSTPQSEESNSCSTLTFSNITTKDSGKYTCKLSMEIPVYVQGEGNGTIITVRTRENRGDDTDDGAPSGTSDKYGSALIYCLRCLPFLVLLVTFFYFNNRWTKPQQHKAAAPENTPAAVQRGEKVQKEEERDEDWGEYPCLQL